MKASLTNEAVTTNESAKTQIAERFLTGFRSRDWGLWNAIMLPGIWLTSIESSRPISQDSGSASSPRSRITNTPSNKRDEFHSEEGK
jgi:hypothetical protein